MKTWSGRVVKAVASKFWVDTDGEVKVCFARKKLKAAGPIYVGDAVEVAKEGDSFVIERVNPRRNVLVRPYVANVDVCLVVLAPEPAPDFLLADKVIVNCLAEGIRPVLVWNKCDIEKADVSEYNDVCECIACSAETGEGIDMLARTICGKTACFAGQSAVGKSSIINALLDSPVMQVGELAKKIKRGRHTTRRAEILPLGNGTYLVDTCGFSMLDAVDMPPEELRLYFDDMEKFRPQCRFNMCLHLDEPDCAVKAHIGHGVSEGRYTRYKLIYNELYDRRKNQYD